MSTPSPDAPRRWLTVLVAAAGFTFLIYEVSWFRMLSLALGATVRASTLVLAVFMVGLGLGAVVWGGFARDRQRLERWLAVLLLGVGIVGLASHPFLTRLIPGMFARPGFAGAPEAAIDAAVVSGLLLATVLMGGVYPLASQLVARTGASVAGTLGRLYAGETLGSALGGLLAGFLLLGTLGQRGTLLLAAVIDLGLALWLLRLRVPETKADDEVPARAPRDAAATGRSEHLVWLAAAASGAAMLALQVLWLRAFRIYLTNTSYGFALIASLVILGVFVGSAVYARRGAALHDPRRALVWSLAGLGVTSLAGLLLLLRLPQVLMFPFESALQAPMLRVIGIPALAALLVVVPPAACSGFLLPLACRLAVRRRSALASAVGRVLLANTLGAGVGPLVAAFVLLPGLGVASSILLVVVSVLTVAGALAWRAPDGRTRIALLAVAAGLAAVVATTPDWKLLPPSFVAFDRDVLFYRESVEGTLAVGQDPGRGGAKYTFVNNSAVIGSSFDAIKVVKMVGHFPFLMGLDARDVLVVGFGIGVTTSAIAAHPSVERIDCAELVPGLVDAAGYYRDLNHDVADDPRLTVIGDDGRHFLQRTDRAYDLISCDPTHPILGSGGLYTRDYFELCRAQLKPGGMVSQYLPLHKLGEEELLGLIATFAQVFPHSALWLGHFHAVLLGGLEPMTVDFGDWSTRVAQLGEDEHFYVDPYHLAVTLALDEAGMAEVAATYPANTDDRSYTEFFAPGCLDPDNLAANLRALVERRVAPSTVFTGIEDHAQMDRFVAGNRKLTEALYYKLAGHPRRSFEALREAVRVNPENEEYPFLIRLYF